MEETKIDDLVLRGLYLVIDCKIDDMAHYLRMRMLDFEYTLKKQNIYLHYKYNKDTPPYFLIH